MARTKRNSNGFSFRNLTRRSGKKTKKISFRSKFSRTTLFIFALVFANVGTFTLIFTQAAVSDGAYESVEIDQYNRINGERNRHGTKSVVRSACLTEVAREWAKYMAETDDFRHSDFGTNIDRKCGSNWSAAGENVGRNYAGDGVAGASAHVFQLYLNSAGHHQNIDNPAWNFAGTGAYVKNNELKTVHVFAQCNGCGGGWTQTPSRIGDPSSSSVSTSATRNKNDLITATHADFNGDGRDDIFWYGPGGTADSIWYGTSTKTKFDIHTDVSVSGSNYIPIVGDFNGDGRSDIFWYGPGSTSDSMWYGGTSRGSFTKTSNVSVGGSAYKPVAGDFNGDGRDDIFWYAPGSGADYLWYFNSSLTSYKSVQTSVNGTYIAIPGDFNGDGRSDVFFYAPGDTGDYVWYFNSSYGSYSSVAQSVNGSNYAPVPGDFNGDNEDDILFYAPGSEVDYVWYGRTTKGSFRSLQTPINGVYNAVPGDFNGDGRGDILWYGPTGGDYLWFGNSTEGKFDSSSNVNIGGSSYLPTP